jgi:Domain of unknown function (DUF4440)
MASWCSRVWSWDKPAAIATMREVAPWSSFQLSDFRITATDDVGLVTYTAVGQRSGKPQYEAVMSSVYVRHGETWKLLCISRHRNSGRAKLKLTHYRRLRRFTFQRPGLQPRAPEAGLLQVVTTQ